MHEILGPTHVPLQTGPFMCSKSESDDKLLLSPCIVGEPQVKSLGCLGSSSAECKQRGSGATKTAPRDAWESNPG